MITCYTTKERMPYMKTTVLLLTALLLTACTTTNTNPPLLPSPTTADSLPITESTSPSTTLTQTFENEHFSFRHPADIKPEKRSDEGIQLIKRGPTQRTETELYDGLEAISKP